MNPEIRLSYMQRLVTSEGEVGFKVTLWGMNALCLCTFLPFPNEVLASADSSRAAFSYSALPCRVAAQLEGGWHLSAQATMRWQTSLPCQLYLHPHVCGRTDHRS